MVDPHRVAGAVQILVGESGPMLAPLAQQAGLIPFPDPCSQACSDDCAQGQQRVGIGVMTAEVNVEVSDHAALDKLLLHELARQLRVYALLGGFDCVPQFLPFAYPGRRVGR
jgi:hypothetical protein